MWFSWFRLKSAISQSTYPARGVHFGSGYLTQKQQPDSCTTSQQLLLPFRSSLLRPLRSRFSAFWLLQWILIMTGDQTTNGIIQRENCGILTIRKRTDFAPKDVFFVIESVGFGLRQAESYCIMPLNIWNGSSIPPFQINQISSRSWLSRRFFTIVNLSDVGDLPDSLPIRKRTDFE